MKAKTDFLQPGGKVTPPGLCTGFDFSVLSKEGEVFVIPKEERLEAGQDLLFVGYAGLAGALILFREKKEKLSGQFSKSFLSQMEKSLKEHLIFNAERKTISRLLSICGVTAVEAVGEDGAFAAFWTFLDRFGVGAEFWLSDIPISQEIIEICTVWDVNPYELYSGGCFLLAADHGERLKRGLKELGIPAEIIGYVTKEIDRVIYTREGKRFVNKPQKDPLYQILG